MEEINNELEKEKMRLKEENTKDWLTKIFNKKYIVKYLKKVDKNSRDNGREVSLIFCDIDHFKKINDNYGHVVGDQVLKELASILEVSLREGDAVGRYWRRRIFDCFARH